MFANEMIRSSTPPPIRRGSEESLGDLTDTIAVMSELIQFLHSPAYSAGESGRRGACDGCAQVP
jgi:hypothetical protein